MGREGVCQGEGGRATGVGKWAGVAGVASAAYRGQQGWVWPSVPVSGCRCEFPPKVFKVGNGESAGYAAKGGDCWYPVGPRGVIPEVRTEARGRSWGNFLSCALLEPQFQQDYKFGPVPCSFAIALLVLIFLLISD